MSHYIATKEEYLRIKQAWSKAVNSDKAKDVLVPCDEYRYDVAPGSYQEKWKKINEYTWKSANTGHMRVSGWITAEHHLLYNILRGKPLHTGFNPIKNPNKLNVYISDMHNFYHSVQILRNRVDMAQKLIKDREAVEKLRTEHTFVNMVDKLREFMKSKDVNMLEENTGFIGLVNKLRGHLKNKPKDLLSESSKKYNELRLEHFLAPFEGAITNDMLAKLDGEQLQMILMFDRHQANNYWLKVA